MLSSAMLLQIITPTNISINGNPCSIQLNITLSNVVPNDTTSGISPFSEEVIAGDMAKVEQATSGSVSSHILLAGSSMTDICYLFCIAMKLLEFFNEICDAMIMYNAQGPVLL